MGFWWTNFHTDQTSVNLSQFNDTFHNDPEACHSSISWESSSLTGR
jgi:hypothetical protein